MQIVTFFFFNDTATTEIYTLSLHDALPISGFWGEPQRFVSVELSADGKTRIVVDRDAPELDAGDHVRFKARDRKSTRLNSSHVRISYAVFCLKKKKKHRYNPLFIAKPTKRK